MLREQPPLKPLMTELRLHERGTWAIGSEHYLQTAGHHLSPTKRRPNDDAAPEAVLLAQADRRARPAAQSRFSPSFSARTAQASQGSRTQAWAPSHRDGK